MPDAAMPDDGIPDAGRADLLSIEDLHVHFHTTLGTVRAVNGVSLQVPTNHVMGLVGESGCGKSVTARAVLRIIPPPGKIESGRVLYHPPGRGGRRSGAAAAGRARAARDPRASRGDDLPGADDLPEPRAPHRPADHGGDSRARAGEPGGGAGAGGRPAERRGDAEAGAPARRLHVRAVRRYAPAGHDRRGAGRQSRAADRRRAHHGGRRHHPGADHGAVAIAAAVARHVGAVHLARSRPGGGDERADRGHVPGQDRRARRGRRGVPAAPAPLHQGAHGVRAAPVERAQDPATDHRRDGSRRAAAPAGLPVQRAVLGVHAGCLRPQHARPHHRRG